MNALRPLEVIIIFDETISPPGPKMVVAIHPANGWFYRINTKPWRPAVLLERSPDHLFLDHDSYLECWDPLELDDDTIERSMRRKGVIDSVSLSKRDEIKRYLIGARWLSRADKDQICAVLDAIA